MARADFYGIQRRRTEVYSDIANDFSVNPFTGDLARVTNEQAIKQALVNLVLTESGERFYDLSKGSKLSHSLFENYDPGNFELMRHQLVQMIHTYEPRVNVQDIRLNPLPDQNSISITLVFSVINIPEIQDVTFTVRRVR